MSDGNRGNRSEALAAAVFGALAVFGAIFLLYALGVLNGRESERREQTPTSYSQAAKTDAHRACAGLERGASFECVYERVEASQEQARGEQDLSAQQRAASAALASAVVALLTLIVTIIGVWFIKRTLDATLEAVEDTSLATVEMGRANEIAREALALQGRAWLTVGAQIEGHLEMSDQHPEIRISVALTITNVGSNPATNVALAVELRSAYKLRTNAIQREIADKQRTVPEIGWHPNTTLFAGQHFRQTHNVGTGVETLAELREAFSNFGTPVVILPLVIVGCAQYRLPGSTELHQTGFAYEVRMRPTPARGSGIFESDLPIPAERLCLLQPFDGPGLID